MLYVFINQRRCIQLLVGAVACDVSLAIFLQKIICEPQHLKYLC